MDQRYDVSNNPSKMSFNNNDNNSHSPPVSIRDIQDGNGPNVDPKTSTMNVLVNEENEYVQDQQDQYLTKPELEKRNEVVD